ncbi:iron ABC transporter permease [Neiella marina]|uniref:Iron ABC transporter permease n=1 Tax=Neiella holothuriorum TaxID=2870530 RepID=A0ABS7EDA9_9GAMM|nr:iron ABC transporter permease [Neiella holothuriorum]MBW8190199.1 iron ABC transporter permease [Neiella holothuriorum]
MNRRAALLLIFVPISLWLGLSFGASNVSVIEALQCGLFARVDPSSSAQGANCVAHHLHWQILVDVRLPRVLTAFLAGAGLALSGHVLQRVSRNPLADPYLFGIVAGAGLGAVVGQLVVTRLGLQLAMPLLAFIGALTVTCAVFFVMCRQRWQQIERILLAGVAMSFLCTAMTSFVLYLQSPHAANRVLFWLMGSLAAADWAVVALLLPIIVLGSVIIWGASRVMDAIQLSDDAVHALGINLNHVRIVLMVVVSAMTATVVAFCGGIGFVGLMIPHVVRFSMGNHRTLNIIGCIIGGGSFLVLVDLAARVVLPNQEIPIGIITAAIGSLFFLGLMQAKRT